MYEAKDKSEYYLYLKDLFKKNGIEASIYEEINYGLQFSIVLNGRKCLIRIYESKKNGVRCDLSQVKDEGSLKVIEELLHTGIIKTENEDKNDVLNSEGSDAALIGTDESGKGDYFGPLVIAGVYANAESKKKLMEIGAVDSKTLSDTKIHKLSEDIVKICRYSIVTIGNKRYNELYDEIKNLNKLLAWGHARVIENLLESVDCGNVLSDQFGSPDLIKSALLVKGRKVNLKQMPGAEENVVVAAASILARNEYVKAMNEMSEKYQIDFPKGGSSMVVEKAREFILSHGRENLENVAKLHFVITKRL